MFMHGHTVCIKLKKKLMEMSRRWTTLDRYAHWNNVATSEYNELF